MPSFNQDDVDEGLAFLRKKLGQDIFDKIMLVNQEQILFLVDVVTLLGEYLESKHLRRWFLNPIEKLDDKPPVDFLKGEWDPDHIDLMLIRALSRAPVEETKIV